MKVLFIHCRYKLAGGEDGVVSAEVQLLRSGGIDVELLTFSNEGSSLLKILQLPFNISSYFKTRRQLKAFKPDVVHVHNLHFAASTSVLYAVKSKKVPFVVTLHNFRLLCPSGTLYHSGKPYLKSLYSGFPWAAVRDGVYNNSKLLTFWVGFSSWINRLIGTWKIPDRYIVLTAHAKSIFEKSNSPVDSDKVIIKPNFVYDPNVSTGSNKKNFLFVGRLSEEKGIHVLLEAFKATAHSLKIIGDGPLKSLVEASLEEHPNITYVGYQQKDTIIKELTNCDALIFPSVWYETFGLTIIEAFATSTPVIASNIGSASLLINNGFNGLHFEESNTEDLKNKLNKWQALGEDEKNAYRKNARSTYEQFYTPAENLKQLLSIYTAVIDQKKKEAANLVSGLKTVRTA